MLLLAQGKTKSVHVSLKHKKDTQNRLYFSTKPGDRLYYRLLRGQI